jgi:uncharacterized protein (TIGR03000 family)
MPNAPSGFRAGPTAPSTWRGNWGDWNHRRNFYFFGLGFYPGWYGGFYPWYGYDGWDYPWSYGRFRRGYAPDYYGYTNGYAPSYSYDYGYAPDYTTYPAPALSYPESSYPVIPPADSSAAADNTVRINVRVPPDAEVWVEGQATRQAGPVREFASPPITPGRDYTYEIRARWREGDREVTRARDLTVRAGDAVSVDFTRRAAAPAGEAGSEP